MKRVKKTSGLFRVLPNALTKDGKLRIERLQFMTRKEFRKLKASNIRTRVKTGIFDGIDDDVYALLMP